MWTKSIEKIQYWAFSFGQRKKTHTHKKCPMGLIKDLYILRTKKGPLSFYLFVPFFFFFFLHRDTLVLFVYFSTLYTPTFLIPILPSYISLIKKGILISFFSYFF